MSAGRHAIELQGRSIARAAVPAASAAAPAASASASATVVAQPSILISSHQTNIFPSFNMQGVVALPHTGQFLLFGQQRNEAYAGRQPDDKFNGRLEIRTKDAKQIVASKITPTSMVWHMSAFPRHGEDRQLLVALQDNGNDSKNHEDFVRAQIVAITAEGPNTTRFLELRSLQAYPSWLPAVVFQPPRNVVTSDEASRTDYISTNAWRINLEAHRVESRTRGNLIASCAIYSSSQYVVYSPERPDGNQYAILGNVSADQVGMVRMPKRIPQTASARTDDMLTTLGVLSRSFRSAAWFNHSHYVISCNDKQLIFGCADYPNIQVRVLCNNVVHAIAPIPNQPAIITSETDGSLNVYDVRPQFDQLQDDLLKALTLPQPPATVQQCFATTSRQPETAADVKHMPATVATAKAAAGAGESASVTRNGLWRAAKPKQAPSLNANRIAQLVVPPSGGWWTKIWSPPLADLAALSDDETTTVLQHARESQTLNVFKLKNMQTLLFQYLIAATQNVLLPDLTRIIFTYVPTQLINDTAAAPQPSEAQPNKNPPKLKL